MLLQGLLLPLQSDKRLMQRLARGIILILLIIAEPYKICKRAQRSTEDTKLALPIIAKPLVIRVSNDLEAKKKVDVWTAKPTRIGPFCTLSSVLPFP